MTTSFEIITRCAQEKLFLTDNNKARIKELAGLQKMKNEEGPGSEKDSQTIPETKDLWLNLHLFMFQLHVTVIWPVG